MAKIFISYRRADSSSLATLLSLMLKQHGIDAFVDTRNMDGGGPFPNRLRNAIEDADVFVCLLGATTLESEWVRKEIEYAHNLGKVLIPVFQERYSAPSPTPDDHVDALLQSDGIPIFDIRNVYIDAAIASLAEIIDKSLLSNSPSSGQIAISGNLIVKKIRASDKAVVPQTSFDLKQLADSVLKILPPPFEWCFVPGGDVVLNTEPPKAYTTPDFVIAKYTITNAQFQVFVEARDGYMYEDHYKWYNFSNQSRDFRSRNPKPRTTAFQGDDLPRTNLSWYDCVAFTRWLAFKTSLSITLPTEQQWQRAAVGDNGWRYPWGDGFDSARCNTKEADLQKPVSVTSYPNGSSPFGVFNMIGNVWEWCLTDYTNSNAADIISHAPFRVLRGGSFNFNQNLAAALYRVNYSPFSFEGSFGLRLVMNTNRF